MKKLRTELFRYLIRHEYDEENRKFKNISEDDLEEILWMLYNPTGVCEECGLDWDSLSCSCKGCEYDELDIINEPCNNHQFCVCDYFDGKPTKKQIENLINNLLNYELSDSEKIKIHNWEISKYSLHKLNEVLYEIITRTYHPWKFGILDLAQLMNKYDDYLDLKDVFSSNVKNNFDLLKSYFELVDNYVSPYDRFRISVSDFTLDSHLASDFLKQSPEYQSRILEIIKFHDPEAYTKIQNRLSKYKKK